MNARAVLETLDRVGFDALRALLSVLWQSSILLVAVALLAFLLRRKAASLRHALWAGALLLAALLPLFAWAISQLDVPQAPLAVMPVYEPVEWAAPVEFAVAPAVAPGMPLSPPPRFSLTDYPWAVGFAAYCISAALFLSLFTIARLRIGSWIRKARPVTEPRAVEAFRSAREMLRLRRKFNLKETDAVQTAITIGTLRPSVLLPAGFAQGLSEVELRAVAVHEMSHSRRRDPLVLTLASLARAVLFFHPLVWLACRQISHLAEAACDDAVLEVTGEPITYAKMLARLAEELPRRSLSTELAAGVVLSKGALLRRVEAILSDRRDQIRRLSRLALVGMILGIALSLGLALFLPVAEKGERGAAKEPWREPVDGVQETGGPSDLIAKYAHFLGRYATERHPDTAVVEITLKGNTFIVRDLGGPSYEAEVAPDGLHFADPGDRFRVRYDATAGKYYQDVSPIHSDNAPSQVRTVELIKVTEAADGPWGEAAGGFRMRARTVSRPEYHRRTPLRLEIELQNVGTESADFTRIGPSWEAEVRGRTGKRLVVRPPIDMVPWEGSAENLAGGATVRWLAYFDRMRFAQAPKAGDTVRVRFSMAVRGKGDVRLPGNAPLTVSSNWVELYVRDDFPPRLQAADIPDRWVPSMDLVYREEVPLLGYLAVHIDGDGNARVVKHGEIGPECPSGATQTALGREDLDRLARFFREKQVWELDLKGERIAYPDEPEIRVSLASSGASLVRTFPQHAVEEEPAVAALQREIHHLVSIILQRGKHTGDKAEEPTLPDGVTVELVGLTDYPWEGGPWWQPDGGPLDAPYDKHTFDITSVIRPDWRKIELALRLGGEADGPAWEASVRRDGARRSRGLTQYFELQDEAPLWWAGRKSMNGQPLADIKAIAVVAGPGWEQFDLRLLIAAGKWHTLADSSGSVTDAAGVRFAPSVQENGETVVSVRHQVKDAQARIIALGTDGAQHTGFLRNEARRDDHIELTWEFRDLPTAAIKSFALQTRPYHWIEFKNVSLKLGHKTDVQVVAEQVEALPGRIEGVLKPAPPEGAAATGVKLSGRVLDDETGEPIQDYTLQWGWPGPDDPARIAWGRMTSHLEGRTDGSFDAWTGWPEGQRMWCRVWADGYLPQPVTAEPLTSPGAATDLEVRLKRGLELRGRVVDHQGVHVTGARVFLGGAQFIELVDGEAERFSGSRATTDQNGRFALKGAGEGKNFVIVSAPSLHVWLAHALEAGQEATIELPEPATVIVRYDIEGDEPVGQVRLQLKTWDMPAWKGVVSSVQTPRLANKGETALKNVTPGVYDLARIKRLRLGDMDMGAMCDRRTVTLEGGKAAAIEFVRTAGQPITGQVTGLKEAGVPGAFIYVKEAGATGDPRNPDESKLATFDALTCDVDGQFKTARIPPGTYTIAAAGYTPEPFTGTVTTGIRLPDFVGTAQVTIPERGEPPHVRIEMKRLTERAADGARASVVPDEEEAAWGEAVEGVQVRLRAERRLWHAGEKPVFWIDVRNAGEHVLRYSQVVPDIAACDIECDGTLYRPELSISPRPGRPAHEPGEERLGAIRITRFAGYWINERTGQWLELTPGRHTLRVFFRPGAKEVPLVVSNPVEITIEPALPGSQLGIEEAVVDPDLAFAALCEAVSDAAEDWWKKGGYDATQEFKILEVLIGAAPPSARVELTYGVRDGEEREVRKGEKVIWIVRKARKEYRHPLTPLKALSDTPESRKALLDAVEKEAAGPAGDQEAGELTIYPFESEIGVVARRIFRDGNGRITKTIYYGLRRDIEHPRTGPYKDNMLTVQSVQIHRYDALGREVRTEHYTPDMALSRIMETSYHPDGTRESVVWRSPAALRTYEIRFGPAPSDLYFDDSGERLVAVGGALPQDMDLAYGWGEAADGICCGIAPNRQSAPLEEVRIFVTVLNKGTAPGKVVTSLPYQELQMELRDGDGNLVPQDTDYIAKRNEDLIRMNAGLRESLQTIPAGEAGYYRDYELKEWYSGLKPGKYQLTVRRRGSGEEYSLVSNTVGITIEVPKAERGWGPVSNGLQCRLLPLEQTVEVPEGTKPEDVEVYVTYELRNVGKEAVRLLAANTPLDWDSGGFDVNGPDGEKVRFWGALRAGPPLGRDNFLALAAGQTVVRRVRLCHDFTQPGLYSVSILITWEQGYTFGKYYRADADEARENPDNVWTGTLTSNTVTVTVVRLAERATENERTTVK